METNRVPSFELCFSNCELFSDRLTRVIRNDRVDIASIQQTQVSRGREIRTGCVEVVISEQPICADTLIDCNRMTIVTCLDLICLASAGWHSRYIFLRPEGVISYFGGEVQGVEGDIHENKLKVLIVSGALTIPQLEVLD